MRGLEHLCLCLPVLALSQGASATQIAAIGPYDSPTNTLQATLAGVCLQ